MMTTTAQNTRCTAQTRGSGPRAPDLFLGLCLLLATAATACGAQPPYPRSPVIGWLDWDSTATALAPGSDNWPATWGPDNRLYTAYGDGWGFRNPAPPEKLSMGWARLEGEGSDPSGFNIPSPHEQLGDGPRGKKASGMVCIRGALYLAVRNADQNGNGVEIWASHDRGRMWRDSGWDFPELGYGAFLNFGRDYHNSRDEYVYLYSPNISTAYIETDEVVLARAPVGRIMYREAWEFYAGGSDGSPEWSSDIEDRRPVFVFPGGCNRLDVTFNAGLNRYLMTMRSRAEIPGNPNYFGIFDAPEPWGPWTTAFYTEKSLVDMSALDGGNGGWGESQHIPSKWISEDGRRFYLLYSGDDHFRTRGVTVRRVSIGPDE